MTVAVIIKATRECVDTAYDYSGSHTERRYRNKWLLLLSWRLSINVHICVTLAYNPDLLVRLFHVSPAPMFEPGCFTHTLYTLALGISTTPVSETSVPLIRASKLQAVVL